MSLERRIAEALHAADDYQPSDDLFSRLNRSIEEDRAHRRRIGQIAAGVMGGGIAIVAFLASVVTDESTGLTIPSWALQLVAAAVMASVLITLGPALRRLGQPLLDEVFRLSPATGIMFSRLLDIAYYLFFGGLIVSAIQFNGLATRVAVNSDEVLAALFSVGGFLLVLGIAHVTNLAILPVVGLLFSSLPGGRCVSVGQRRSNLATR